jgi:hypothetical protein
MRMGSSAMECGRHYHPLRTYIRVDCGRVCDREMLARKRAAPGTSRARCQVHVIRQSNFVSHCVGLSLCFVLIQIHRSATMSSSSSALHTRWLAYDSCANDADNVDIEPGNTQTCSVEWTDVQETREHMEWKGFDGREVEKNVDDVHASPVEKRMLVITLKGAQESRVEVSAANKRWWTPVINAHAVSCSPFRSILSSSSLTLTSNCPLPSPPPLVPPSLPSSPARWAHSAPASLL